MHVPYTDPGQVILLGHSSAAGVAVVSFTGSTLDMYIGQRIKGGGGTLGMGGERVPSDHTTVCMLIVSSPISFPAQPLTPQIGRAHV